VARIVLELWSVGHSTHSFEHFVALLAAHGIKQVVDIRTVPKSRRNPHFHGESLAAELPDVGIAYAHLKALGGWRKATPNSPNDGWRNLSFRGYADHAMTAGFAAGLARLQLLAAAVPTAMMCSEALWWRCHRRLVADRLVLGGQRVWHIGPDGHASAHQLTSFATVVDDHLEYPSQIGTTGSPL
jgi:uncharacterized protein (DUF488 family)